MFRLTLLLDLIHLIIMEYTHTCFVQENILICTPYLHSIEYIKENILTFNAGNVYLGKDIESSVRQQKLIG